MWGNGIGMGRGQKGGMGLSMIKIFNFFVCVFDPFEKKNHSRSNITCVREGV